MKINKKSWHYKWYRWTYTTWHTDWRMPDHTNLCQYTQRIFWMSILEGPLWFLKLVYATIYYTFGTVVAFLFGFRPVNLFSSESDWNGPIGYKPYPGIDIGLPFNVLPWQPVVLAAIIGAEVYLWPRHTGVMIGIHSVLALIVFGLIASAWYYTDSETARLAKAWVSSKKSKVCPLVDFVDEPTSLDE